MFSQNSLKQSLPQFMVRVPFSAIDWAGRIFYSRIFEFAQMIMEDFLKTTPLVSVRKLIENEEPLPVVVSAKAEYFIPIVLGDELQVQVSCHRIGKSSFTLGYDFFKKSNNGENSLLKKKTPMNLVAHVEIVHVLVKTNGRKTSIPLRWKKVLHSICPID